MKTKAETKVKEYWSSPKVIILTCSWESVEYGLDLLKRCLRFALLALPKNVFIKRRRLSSFTFIYELWLVITASWEHLAAVVFMSNKFMSSCVICLVIAKEIFLFQWDCSAITKRAYYFVIELIMINLFCKQTLKAEDTLYMQIGYFPTQTNFWSFLTSMPVFTADFSSNHSSSIICKTSSLLLLFSWFDWLERS